MKKFLIIGNVNAISYKEVFPLIKENQIWMGTQCVKEFILKDGTIKGVSSRWFTNLEHNKRNEPLVLTKKYDPALYPKYDNYNAINVDKVKDIPMDYNGEIGVPITFLDKYCPEQFEIIGAFTNNKFEEKAENGYVLSTNTITIRKNGMCITNEPVINKKSKYKRIVIKRKIYERVSDYR